MRLIARSGLRTLTVLMADKLSFSTSRKYSRALKQQRIKSLDRLSSRLEETNGRMATSWTTPIVKLLAHTDFFFIVLYLAQQWAVNLGSLFRLYLLPKKGLFLRRTIWLETHSLSYILWGPDSTSMNRETFREQITVAFFFLVVPSIKTQLALPSFFLRQVERMKKEETNLCSSTFAIPWNPHYFQSTSIQTTRRMRWPRSWWEEEKEGEDITSTKLVWQVLKCLSRFCPQILNREWLV